MKKQTGNSFYKYNSKSGRKRLFSSIAALLIGACTFSGQSYTVTAAQAEVSTPEISANEDASAENTQDDGLKTGQDAANEQSGQTIPEAPSSENEQDIPETTSEEKMQDIPETTSKENTQIDAPQTADVSDTADAIPSIAAISPLSQEQSTISFDSKPALSEVTAKLPAVLSVTLEGASAPTDIPVTWSCSDDYENTSFDTYEFTPSWDTAAYPLSPQLNAFTAVPYVTVNVSQARAQIYLMNLEKAKSSLDTLVKSKPILALVYLCDSYELKQAPGQNESTIVTAGIGQSVQIIGAGEDSSRNIWYQVTAEIGGASYTGFIERKNLAYSDEDFINWERKNINIYLYRSAGSDPALAMVNGVSADIAQFPSSYQSALTSLKSAHGNWIFVPMNTGVDWNSAVQAQNQGSRSLIHSSANAAWKKSPYDSSWSYPTDGILAYYMDPRNFLNDNYIFQFELLTYNATYHTETAVQNVLNGTFMTGTIPNNNQTYAQAFCSIGKQLNVSPFHLASRVRQEQGANGSALISGTYPGYERLYNYFNIGATGKGNTEVIVNGLTKARSYGWTSHLLSLQGGANIISQSYIQKGQDTLYLQKFNVNRNSASGLFNHQYMQNIAAPSSEAASVKKAYTTAGSVNNPFVFRIPVYDNMPGAACPKPAAVKEVLLNKNELTLKTDKTAVLSATIDGKVAQSSSVAYKSSNTAVASVDANGTVTAVSPGTAVITCSSSGAASASCTVTVEKGDPAYTLPTLGAVTYDSGKTLQSVTLPAGWSWDNPAIVPTVINSGYPATYTPSDTGKYNTVRQTLSLTVTKGIPTYQIPGGLQCIAGNPLASLKLPAGFVWEAPSTVLNKSGSYPASYNPDGANYQTVTGISISVTVTEASTVCKTHTYGDWFTTTNPTCTAAGVQTRYCSTCSASETSPVAALTHIYTSAVTKNATETETGIRTYTCSLCGDTYTETIDKLPVSHTHSYTAGITTNATCTGTGMKTYTCSCGDSYTESLPALGHSYTSMITKEATEKDTGIRTYTCSTCNSTYTETIAKLPAKHTHSYTSSVTRQAACTEKGIKTYACSCGDTYTEEIAALGHDMADGKCRRCGYTEPKPNESANNNSSSGGNSSGNTSSSPASNNGAGSASAAANNTAGSTSATTNSSTGNTTLAAGSPAGNSSAAVSSSAESAAATAGSSANGTSSNSDTANTPDGIFTVDMKATSVLYEETISTIRGQDVEVILNMGNSISWTINGRNIVADEANGIDMGVKVNSKNIPEEIMNQAASISETATVLELSLAHNGSLDFLPILTISTASDNAGRMAALFYYNPDTNELEFVSEAEVAASGDICFTFSHASDYAVIISDSSLAAVKTITAAGIIDGIGDEASSAQVSDDTDTSYTPNGKTDTDKIALSPTTIVIIVIILLIIIAIGCTAFFMFRSKEDDYAEEAEEDDEEDDYIEYTVASKNDFPIAAHDAKSKNNRSLNDGLDYDDDYDGEAGYDDTSDYDDERSEYNDSDDAFIDDYHEPAAAPNMRNNGDSVAEYFDDDEFDGFE